jgi:hypothetical protein
MTDAGHDELPVIDAGAAPCRHLRNKGMYIYNDGRGHDPHSGYDSSIYWCLKTLKNAGPDDEIVGGSDCRDTQRTCYEPL